MSATDDGHGGGGFGAAAFELLNQLETDTAASEAVDQLWVRARRLLRELGASLFGEADFSADLWPEGKGDDGNRGQFLWGRLKQAGNEQFATHIGVFLAPGLCNLSIDLEKDLLDAGQAAESLERFIEFCRAELPSMLRDSPNTDLQVWTDTTNVVAAAEFEAGDFSTFMAANRDASHPWPKVGYILSTDDVVRFGDTWVEEYHVRATRLVPIYDAMIRNFGD